MFFVGYFKLSRICKILSHNKWKPGYCKTCWQSNFDRKNKQDNVIMILCLNLSVISTSLVLLSVVFIIYVHIIYLTDYIILLNEFSSLLYQFFHTCCPEFLVCITKTGYYPHHLYAAYSPKPKKVCNMTSKWICARYHRLSNCSINVAFVENNKENNIWYS